MDSRFDKKLGKQTQDTYLTTKVNILPFANPKALEDMLEQLEEIMKELQGKMEQHSEWFMASSGINTSTTNTIYTMESPVSPQKSQILMNRHRLEGISQEEDEQVERCLATDDATAFEEILNKLGLPTMLKRKINHGISSSVTLPGIGISSTNPSTTSVQLPYQNPSSLSLPGQSRSYHFYSRLAGSLMRRACHHKAKQCLAYLIKAGADISGADDMNERSFLHLLVISGGSFHRIDSLFSKFRHKSPGWSHDYSLALPFDDDEEEDPHRDDPDLLTFILDLSESAASHLVVPDIFGRIPLHYAALYGYHRITKVLVKHLKNFEPTVPPAGSPADVIRRNQPLGCSWVDHEGHSSLFYAVLRGHHEVVRILIDLENVDVDDCSVASVGQLSSVPIAPSSLAMASPNLKGSIIPKVNIYSHTPLALACKFGHVEIVKLLLDRGANVDFQDEDGETPLHLCAKNGFADCVELLVNPEKIITAPKLPLKKVNLDVREKLNGYTPLFHAAIEGHKECVEILLRAGSSVTLTDFDDWTPHEHAVFRGHLSLAKILKPSRPDDLNLTVSTPKISPTDDEEDEADVLSGVKRSYGHNYLKDQCMVIINLGVNDIRKNVPAIQLNSNAPTIYPSLSLVVSATNAAGEPAIVDLPAKETFDPIIFYSHQGKPNLNDVRILPILNFRF